MAVYEAMVAQTGELTAWRHRLHQQPELAFQEHLTSQFVAEKLREFGLTTVESCGGTGVVGIIEGAAPGLSIGLRADMDALPITDRGGRPYASTIEGVAHACGHDGHTVTLLGVARYLAQQPPASGRVVLIFQPAEEAAAGARAMLDDGLLQRFPLDEVYAFHNMPALAPGSAAVESGPTLNGACLWEIEVGGKGGHGASFYTTVDPLQAAARLTVEISSLVGRYLNPADTGLITVGQLQAGTAANIIPDRATLGGTLRGRSPDTMQRLKDLLQRSCQGVAALTGCSIDMRVLVDVPPCINAPQQAEFAAGACCAVLGAGAVSREMKPLPFTDDFAHLLQAVPGAYLFLGQDSEMCHHPAYDFDDRLLAVAGAIFLTLVEARLGQ